MVSLVWFALSTLPPCTCACFLTAFCERSGRFNWKKVKEGPMSGRYLVLEKLRFLGVMHYSPAD